jgi:hypothetical protein
MAERAWPFEDTPEGGARIRDPEDFLARHREGIEAVIVRIGLNDAQLVLVDGLGRWERWVYHSVEEAKAVAENLGIEAIHDGEYPEELRVRINAYQRPADSFDDAAYPEQASVGPVIPYPENRRRRVSALKKEVDQAPEAQEQAPQ